MTLNWWSTATQLGTFSIAISFSLFFFLFFYSIVPVDGAALECQWIGRWMVPAMAVASSMWWFRDRKCQDPDDGLISGLVGPMVVADQKMPWEHYADNLKQMHSGRLIVHNCYYLLNCTNDSRSVLNCSVTWFDCLTYVWLAMSLRAKCDCLSYNCRHHLNVADRKSCHRCSELICWWAEDSACVYLFWGLCRGWKELGFERENCFRHVSKPHSFN